MDFKCKCGSESFFIQSKGSQIGLYCSVCGKWQKWLTKNEVRQFEYETNTLDSKENNPDDDFYEKFALTPWGCLHCAFRDFGLDLPEIPGKMADAIMEDFFEIMKKYGLWRKSKNDC